MLKIIPFFLLFSFGAVHSAYVSPSPDQILGKWISVRENLIVQVFREDNKFKAKIIWFNDSDDKTKPMSSRLDEKNPDPSLKNRKVIGMEVLRDLSYNADTNQWEGGEIYDANSGRYWSAYLYFASNGLLMVKGYWHFKFIGKALAFRRLAISNQ